MAAWLSIVSERPDIMPEHDLRSIISSHNTAVGGINHDPQGCHETVMRCFIHAVRLHLAAMVDASLTDQVNALSRSRSGHRDCPLHFFCRERLLWVAARKNFVTPDLAPLPQLCY